MKQLVDDIGNHKKFTHDTLQKGFKAASAKITSEYERIGKEIGNSAAGNIDDTPVKIGKKSGRLNYNRWQNMDSISSPTIPLNE